MSTTALSRPEKNNGLQFNLIPFQQSKAVDVCNIITSIVAPIFFIIALSLAVFYGIHPIEPMISMSSNFALSLPVLICGSMGLASAFTFMIQIARKKAVLESYERACGQFVYDSQTLNGLVEFALQPGGRKGQTVDEYRVAHQYMITLCQTAIGPIHEFQARDMKDDDIHLRGYWLLQSVDAPTVILFHGNAATLESMSFNLGLFYKSFGFNILLAEYRNYGISDAGPSHTNPEMGAYLDAEAALKFVLSQGVAKEKVVVHGYSLGGAYAASLGCFYEVRHVILDHTFTSYAAVTENIAIGHKADYEKEIMEADSEIEGAKLLSTDGFNSLSKVRQMNDQIKIFVIRGAEDELIPQQFGQDFLEIHYSNDTDAINRCGVTVEGGHSDIGSFMQDTVAQKKLRSFLTDQLESTIV